MCFTANARSDHHWQPRRQSSAHATSASSSCRPLQFFLIERNVKLENSIGEKETFCLVCVINDVINYSVVKMVLVSLNLNEYHMPVPYLCERYLHTLLKYRQKLTGLFF